MKHLALAIATGGTIAAIYQASSQIDLNAYAQEPTGIEDIRAIHDGQHMESRIRSSLSTQHRWYLINMNGSQ